MGSAASATKYNDDIKLTDIGQVATPKESIICCSYYFY